jgi:LysM repeat protein
MNHKRLCLAVGMMIFLFNITACRPVESPEIVPLANTALTLTPYSTSDPTPTLFASEDKSQVVISTLTPTPVVYLVMKDELGSSIALRYGITLSMLQSANPGVDLNYLKEGQELIIPPKEQTPVPNLSSPTPAALMVTGETCYPAADGAGWCIASITNNQPEGVMYITGEFILLGNGKTRQAPFTADLDVLPPGKTIPIYAYFETPFLYPYQLNVSIQSALLQSSEFEEKDYQILEQKLIYDSTGLAVQITGVIRTSDPAPQGLIIIAAGYAGNQPAGVRKQELGSSLAGGSDIKYQLWLYSVGPTIDRVEIFVYEK